MLGYIKSRIWIFILWFLCCGVFAVVFSGYSLPIGAVFYAGGISLLFSAAFVIVDAARYKNRVAELKKCAAEITISLEKLPSANSELEKLYSDMIQLLFAEKLRIEADSALKATDLSDYYTIWAHQIKTPIAAARLLLQSGEYDSEEMSEQIQKIEEYTEMAMCYARLSSESTDFVIREYSVDELVKKTILKFSSMFLRKGLALSIKPMGLTVVSDEKWLGFVIGQVISNALKYTNSGGVEIYSEGNSLCIKDTGIGISPEDLPRIFEKGYTGLNGRIDDKASGIGLYLCDKICRKLGHKIAAESSDNGTVIRIDLSRQNIAFE